MKRLLVVAACVAALVILLLVRAGLRAPAALAAVAPQAPSLPGDADARARRLALSLTFPTISVEGGASDASAFAAFRSFLADSFPNVRRELSVETVGGGSLLYTWEGRDPGTPPIILLAHYDVVPVEAGTEERWTHPAFDGVVADEAVWGRGSMDDKASVLGIMEAVDGLIAQGFRPTRTIYLAFGHDEETGGSDGAARIARLLAQRGVHAEFALDEGMVIADRFLDGVDRPVALVGVAEKGFVSVELTVEMSGGHSSIPPKNTAVGVLASAITQLEQNPMPAVLGGPTVSMIDALAPEAPLGRRIVLRNLWLFGPIVLEQLAARPETDAALRTTTAATSFESGASANMLPAVARAIVNFRIRPGETVEDVLAHVRATVLDPRVEVRRLGDAGGDPSPTSATDSPAWDRLTGTIHEVFPDVAVAPFLVLGGTDARHYARVAQDIYRFVPLRYHGLRDGEGPHGADERILIEDYEGIVRFYGQLIRNSAGAGDPGSAAAPTH